VTAMQTIEVFVFVEKADYWGWLLRVVQFRRR